MKVLSVLPSLDARRGGTQSGSVNMLIATQRAGIENVVAVPERDEARVRSSALVNRLCEAGVEVRTFAPLARPAELADRWSVSLSQASWIARNARHFDVVHVHGIWGLGLISGLLSGWAAGVPVVVTAHESLTEFDIDDSRSAARRRQKLVIKRLYIEASALFILTSELETGESLPVSVPRRTIPYPLYDENLPLPALTERGRGAQLLLGFLGRFDEKKNLDVLIDAVAELPSHVRLIVAGDGPVDLVRDLHARAAARNLDERIEWLGFVGTEARAQFLSRIDLLAMPSRFESFGMSAAEAMIHGVPVLLSDRVGVSALVRRHGGGVVSGANVDAVRSAIVALDADRKSLAAFCAQGQAAIVAELGFAPIGRAICDAYAHALEESNGLLALRRGQN